MTNGSGSDYSNMCAEVEDVRCATLRGYMTVVVFMCHRGFPEVGPSHVALCS